MPTWLHHLATTYFQWCLFPIGLYGQRLVARKNRKGYVWGLCTQGLWVIYALALNQPLMMIGTLSYAETYVEGWLNWGRAQRGLPPLVTPWGRALKAIKARRTGRG